MKSKNKIISLSGILLLFGALLSACSGGIPVVSGAVQPTSEAIVQEFPAVDTSLSVEGRIIPKDSVQLAFATSGQVAEVLVNEGDQVKKGDVLARLSGRERLEAQVSTAEFELFSAKQALKALDDDLEINRNVALQELNNARQAVHDAERKVKGLGGVADQNDIEIARTQVIFAKNALEKAEKNFAPYASLPEDNLARARLKIEVANKQKDYDVAVRKYNNLTGSASNFDLDQAATTLDIAQSRLTLAVQNYELLQNGPDPDALGSVEARISAAESQLEAAKTDLEKLDLRATMDGKIVSSEIKPGVIVNPAQPVIGLADFSEWDIETEDLTEIEVVNIQPGQKVTVIPDAIPEIVLNGEVVFISDTFQEKRGDITYQVKIKLNEIDSRLRWGMTSIINFER